MKRTVQYIQRFTGTADITFIVVALLGATPVFLWPFIFFMSVFVFDDPTADLRMQWAIFIGINSYPVLLLGNLVLAFWVYSKSRPFAWLLALWPVLFFTALIIIVVFDVV